MEAMMAEARKVGFNHLIKEMNKIGVGSDEKKRSTEKKPEKPAAKKEASPKEKETPSAKVKITDDMKDTIRSFFRDSNKKKEAPAVDLYVGKKKKKKQKKKVPVSVQAKPEPQVVVKKKKTTRRVGPAARRAMKRG